MGVEVGIAISRLDCGNEVVHQLDQPFVLIVDFPDPDAQPV